MRLDTFVARMEPNERQALGAAIERTDVAELERKAIARRIKQARNEAGLSQPEMAEALGVIPRTYQNYESEKDPRVPWGLMNQIATVTGKTTEWLIHGDKETPDLLNEFAPTPALHEQLEKLEGRLDLIIDYFDIKANDQGRATTRFAAAFRAARRATPAKPSETPSPKKKTQEGP